VTDSYVKALLHERDKRKQAKQWDRMRQVDVELAKFGIAVEDDPEVDVEADLMSFDDRTAVEMAVDGPSETVTVKRPRGRPRKTT